MTNKSKESNENIITNKKAQHDYFITERLEAGLALLGWEVKSLRAGRAQVNDSYIVLKNNEAWLLNTHITPLPTVSTHITANPTRSRRLLLHRKELSHLYGAVQRQGFTLIPLVLYWKNNLVKVAIGLAKGKKQYDKREAEKQRDWQRQKQKLTKYSFNR